MGIMPILFEHGIMNEESDIRIHVCFKAHVVYSFPTEKGRDAILDGRGKEQLAFQNGISYPTGRGFLISPDDIDDLEFWEISEWLWAKYPVSHNDGCSKKGKSASSLCLEAIRKGMIKLRIDVNEIDDKELQIKGLDMLVSSKHKIQVKCDFKGGPKELGGTGNLFLQTHELNPLGIH